MQLLMDRITAANTMQHPLTVTSYILSVVRLNMFVVTIVFSLLAHIGCQSTDMAMNETTSQSNITESPSPTTDFANSTTANITDPPDEPTTLQPITTTVLDQSTDAGGATTLMQTEATSPTNTKLITTDIITTEITTQFTNATPGDPEPLTSGIIALIAIIAALVFIFILAGLAYLCQRRSVHEQIKRRFTKNDRPAAMSIHRPDSAFIIDDDHTTLNTFGANRKVETFGGDNSLFLKEPNGGFGKGANDDGSGETVEQNAATKATLPSNARLAISNENAGEEVTEGETDIKASSDDSADSNNTKDEESEEDTAILESAAQTPAVTMVTENATSTNEKEENGENRPQSGVSYKSIDMDMALQEVGDEMQI